MATSYLSDGFVKNNKVRLSTSEIRMCALAGVDQTIYNIRFVNAKPRYGAGRDNDWQYSINGVMGHFAFCKYLGVFYELNMGNYNVSDVQDFYEVRTHQHPYLIIHKEDRDDAPFVSVLGGYGEYEIEGWILGVDAKRDEFWCDKYDKNRPAYFVPKSALKTIETLPSYGKPTNGR